MKRRTGTEVGRDIRYGVAAFALGMPTIPLLIHLPPVYAEDLGLGLTVTGAALFTARLLDVITDPIIGAVSDRLKGPFGRRKPLIALGAIVGAAGVLLLLNPLEDPGALYLSVWTSVLYLGWTLINIPYLAWGADLHTVYDKRARLTGVRESFMLVGILVAGVIPAAAAATGAGSISALAITGWGIVVAGAVVFPLLLLTVAEPAPRPLQGRDPHLPSIRDQNSNGPFNRLLLGWFVNSLANGIPSVLFILFMKHVIGANEITQGLFTLLYFLAGIVGMPLWIWLSRRHSKHRIWCVAMVLASTAFATVPALEAGDILLFGIIVLLTGFCLGADLALPPAMQADVAEYEYFRKGRDRTGIMFAAWSMSTKLALAASVGIALPMLDWLGTPEQGSTEKYDSMTLALIYAGLPVVLKISVTLLIWGYALNKAKLAIIPRRLGTRIKDPSG